MKARTQWLDPDSVKAGYRQPVGPTQEEREAARRALLDRSVIDKDSIRSWLSFGNSALEFDCIYFVRMGSTEAVKIGVAGHMESRLKGLQTSSPVPLMPIALMMFISPKTLVPAEKFAHKRAAGRGKIIRGEWFGLTDSVVKDVITDVWQEYRDDLYAIKSDLFDD